MAQLRRNREGKSDNLLDRLREARRLKPLPPVSHDWLDDLFKRCRDEAAAENDAPPQRKRRPLTFTKRDVARAIAAAKQSGESVLRVEIDGGRIVVVTGQPESISVAPGNEWDSVQ
jgi:hypothetical protein